MHNITKDSTISKNNIFDKFWPNLNICENTISKDILQWLTISNNLWQNLTLSDNIEKQAGAELGQTQLKLGLDFNSINLYYTILIVLIE